MNDTKTINVEVVYGTPEKQLILDVVVPLDTTVEQAIAESCMSQHFPEIDLQENKVGIWNRTVNNQICSRTVIELKFIVRSLQILRKFAGCVLKRQKMRGAQIK